MPKAEEHGRPLKSVPRSLTDCKNKVEEQEQQPIVNPSTCTTQLHLDIMKALILVGGEFHRWAVPGPERVEGS